MGQQQLLLLVLGIVIVGLAVVVGIQAFSENQQKANLDAMINDGVRIASDLQALFPLGDVRITPLASKRLEALGLKPADLVVRHHGELL